MKPFKPGTEQQVTEAILAGQPYDEAWPTDIRGHI